MRPTYVDPFVDPALAGIPPKGGTTNYSFQLGQATRLNPSIASSWKIFMANQFPPAVSFIVCKFEFNYSYSIAASRFTQ